MRRSCDVDEQDRERPREMSPIEDIDRGLNDRREDERQQDQHQHELDLDQQVADDQDQEQRKGVRPMRRSLGAGFAGGSSFAGAAAVAEPAAVGEPDLSRRCSQPHPCLSPCSRVVSGQSNDCGELSASRPRARPRSGRSASNGHPMGRPWPVASPAAAVPDGREGEHLAAIDDDAPRRAKWLVDREDLARWPGDHLCLEPAMLRAAAGVNLPDEIRGDAADIPHQRLFELAVTDRAAHRRARLHPVRGGNLPSIRDRFAP